MNPIGNYTNFPFGFANGVSLRGIPLGQAQPGLSFFLGNGPVLNPQQKAGSDGNRGTYLDPFATLDYAVNTGCTSGRGDILFVLPGHYETISTAAIATLRTAGVAVVGLGIGNMMPTFNFTTAATANIPISAANVSLQNLRFIANFADITSVFTGQGASTTASISGTTLAVTVLGSGTVYPGCSAMGTAILPGTLILNQLTGTTGGVGTYTVNRSQTFASGTITTGSHNFLIDRCQFYDMSSALNFLTYVTSSAIVNGMAGLAITNSQGYGLGATAATAMVTLAEAIDSFILQGNYYTNALAANSGLVLLSTTSKVLTRVLWDRNVINLVGTNAATGALLITTATTNTGVISNNFFTGARAIASAIPVSASSGFKFFQNFYEVTADTSGVILPAYNT